MKIRYFCLIRFNALRLPMRTLQIFITVMLIVCPLKASLLAAKPDRLVVAMPHWPPLKIVDNGKFGGIEVLIFKEIAKRTGIDFVYLECPWVRCLKMMESGEADLITSI